MELAKGVRDYPPELQLLREDLFKKARKAFERYGFAPFATPAIERLETLSFKFTGEEDVQKEIFKVEDQGGRDLGLRFDLTVPLARFVAMNKDLKLPFKRYEIGRCYRDGPIKLGRYREFWQCDADIVGSSSMLADAECVKVASDFLSQLPFEYEIQVNNRKILDAVMQSLSIPDHYKVMLIIDKLDKQPEKVVREELLELLSEAQVERLFAILTPEGTDNGRLKHIEQEIGTSEGISEMRELLGFLSGLAHVRFSPLLSRGLNYYTGTVFEAKLIDSPVKGSVAGGGRYDKIIGQMRGSEDIPAVGISLGIEGLTDAFLAEKRRFDRTSTQVFVIPIKMEREAAQIADRLRAVGIRTDLDVMQRSISKNLDYTDKMGIPFAVIVGATDLKEKRFTLKNMKSGEEHKLPLSDIDTLDLGTYS